MIKWIDVKKELPSRENYYDNYFICYQRICVRCTQNSISYYYTVGYYSNEYDDKDCGNWCITQPHTDDVQGLNNQDIEVIAWAEIEAPDFLNER
jgi:nicotinic acid phosphoribosyltransferase